jgi:ferredoxin
MRIEVDFDACASTGTCVQVAPDLFRLGTDGFLYVLDEQPPPGLHAAAREAADMCPTAAITLVED